MHSPYCIQRGMVLAIATASLTLCPIANTVAPAVAAAGQKQTGAWLSGDFHQHTWYTDGSTSFDFVMQKNFEYDLDWWANSEHGGSRNRDGDNHFWDDQTYYPVNPILGDVAKSSNHQVMWRWQSLRDFVWPNVLGARTTYSQQRIFSGLEWNVPGHEHCSTAIVDEDASAISAFEYQFDTSDHDTSRNGEVTPYGTLSKRNGRIYDSSPSGTPTGSKSYPARHGDAVAACAWMQQQYRLRRIDNGWIIFAHIERDGAWEAASGGGYNVEHFRDLNNAGPDVCYGFEGAPGHQVNHWRGFGNSINETTGESDDFGGTYGGVGIYTAQVGGLWDALLGEGRRWFNYANSDYHRHYTNGGDDFYPGEYQKTWVYAKDANGDGSYSLDEIGDGLRSGNSWFVMGDLINYLEFMAQAGNQQVAMGDVLRNVRRGSDLKLVIKFKSPLANNNGDTPAVDHIDLIAGDITGRVSPMSPNYTKATNESAQVIATFTAANWTMDAEGNQVVMHTIQGVNKNRYFRLRGTNHAPNTPCETDAAGNPLADYRVTANLGNECGGSFDGAPEAWRDLWFYSNPIYVYVAR